MRLTSPVRLFVIGLIAAAGLIGLSIGQVARIAQAQTAATATPIVGVPNPGVPVTYTVKSGDSFNAIARQFNLTPQQLQALNAITNTAVIRVGQVLIVAVSTFTPTPAPTDTLVPTPTVVPTETPTPAPSATATLEPTVAPTSTSTPTARPVATAVPIAIEPPKPPSIPVDVIVVGVVMLFAVIGIFIGFRTQRG